VGHIHPLSKSDYRDLHLRWARILGGAQAPFIAGKEDEDKRVRERLSKAFRRLMGVVYRQDGASLSVSVLQDEDTLHFIDEHAAVLDDALRQEEISDRMRERLEKSNWVFSGMKVYHEMNEAHLSLLDENGQRKDVRRVL